MARNKRRERKRKQRRWREKQVPQAQPISASIDVAAIAAKLKREIDDRIHRLLSINQNYNPLEILAVVAKARGFGDLETGEMPAETHSEALLEHLYALTVAQPFPSPCQAANPDIIQESFDLLDEMNGRFALFYTMSAAGLAKSSMEEEAKFRVKLHSHFVRGDSYVLHSDQHYADLGPLHDAFLRQRFGLTACEFIAALNHAIIQVNSRANEWDESAREAYHKFKQLQTRSPDDPQLQTAFQEFQRYLDGRGAVEIFKIRAVTAQQQRVFELLACKLGDNAAFLQIPNWIGWPMNPSLIHSKPILMYSGDFYAFVPSLLFRNPLSLLEDLIREEDLNYWENSFLQRRDAYLENEAHGLFRRALPGAKAVQNAFFSYEEAGEQRRAEADSVFAYDDALLIIEAKAGKVSDAARRGGIKSLKTDIEEVVDKAYRQGARLIATLEQRGIVELTDEAGNHVLTLRGAQFRFVFVVNVTFESLGTLQENLRIVRGMGFLQGKFWPWSVLLGDLRVVLDILDHPSMFFHYLLRRAEANDVGMIDASDELDLLGFYLAGQLFHGAKPRDERQTVMPVHYTDELDAYYDHLGGFRLTAAPKPKMRLPDNLERLLTQLESVRPPNWLTACIGLLDCSGDTRTEIAGAIEKLDAAYCVRQKPQAAVVYFKEPDRALVLCVGPLNFEPAPSMFPAWEKVQREHNPKEIVIVCWAFSLGSGAIKVFLM